MASDSAEDGFQIWRPATTKSEPQQGDYLVRFLARSKRFPGIGEATTLKLWQAHGPDLYGILAGVDPSPLAGILGPDRAAELLDAWHEDLAESDVAVWLDENRFDTRLANKVVRVWGRSGAAKLKANPYVMLTFASWRQVDDAARRVGIPPDDTRRLIGAVEGALYTRLEQKHTAVPRPVLDNAVASLLGSRLATLSSKAVEFGVADGAAVSAPCPALLQPAGAAVMERYVEDRIRGMGLAAKQGDLLLAPIAVAAIAEALGQFQRAQNYVLTDEQCAAVALGVNRHFGLILGGAGVGKTTVLKALHSVCERHGRVVIQMALAGRAAQRMREATQRPAYTIAGFLMQVAKEALVIPAHALVVVDEASMLDLPTSYRILRALPQTARLLLVGDPAQLPPIGFGLVFHIAAVTPGVPKVELTRIYRQVGSTGIPAVALAIRNGALTDLPHWTGSSPGVTKAPCVSASLTDRLTDILAALGGPDECQILSPLRQGSTGVNGINAHFHKICSPGGRLIPGRSIAVGEPVIWTVNDWERGLMNGSLGRVVQISSEKHVLVDFDGVQHEFKPFEDLMPLQLAYAITIHKAQGSQFRRVLIPVFPSRILDRTLIYTAVTRATEQVVLVGDIRAAGAAVEARPRPEQRVVGFEI
jgi:exodeoxyribonuclease V alpha subunit